MGKLLTFMFLWNMVGALTLLPALACVILITEGRTQTMNIRTGLLALLTVAARPARSYVKTAELEFYASTTAAQTPVAGLSRLPAGAQWRVEDRDLRPHRAEITSRTCRKTPSCP